MGGVGPRRETAIACPPAGRESEFFAPAVPLLPSSRAASETTPRRRQGGSGRSYRCFQRMISMPARSGRTARRSVTVATALPWCCRRRNKRSAGRSRARGRRDRRPRKSPGPRVPCGPVGCPADQVCCNPSCGVCTPPGGACTKVFCGAPSSPVSSPCGINTCNIGDVCCNPSCGICTPPGGDCSKAPCENGNLLPVGGALRPQHVQHAVKCAATRAAGVCAAPGEACSLEPSDKRPNQIASSPRSPVRECERPRRQVARKFRHPRCVRSSRSLDDGLRGRRPTSSSGTTTSIFDLGNEVDDVRRAPVDFLLAARSSEALHLGDGHSLDPDSGRASFTSSSLKGLMFASIFFMNPPRAEAARGPGVATPTMMAHFLFRERVLSFLSVGSRTRSEMPKT